MPELTHTATREPRPLPEVGITIRPATPADIPFMDGLQKLHTRQVGWMPTAQFEGKIRAGHVLIAEEVGSRWWVVGSPDNATVPPTTNHQPPTLLGYCIGNDQYFKRDDVGVIYQMNVVPGKQRGLIGATLLRAMFERSAYGCKLYCCWCAQDIAANTFWEAMGFVALAFRSGSAKKSRTHIFWQKRIRAGDMTTPWWFPSQTSGGSIREDRIVLPIPPGTHWSDTKPMMLPGERTALPSSAGSALVDRHVDASNTVRPGGTCKKNPKPVEPIEKLKRPVLTGAMQFAVPEPPKVEKAAEKKPREAKPKQKNDPRMIAAARELRDRWLDEINTGRHTIEAGGAKYDVVRLNPPSAIAMPALLEAA